MRKKSLVWFIFLLLVLIPSFASARYWAVAYFEGSIDGGHFRSTIRNIDAKWTPSNHHFILHAMWLATDLNYSWIEVGFTEGTFQEPNSTRGFHRGFYTAEGIRNSSGLITTYHEYKIIGPSTQVGSSHNFDIQRDGHTTWGIYINWNLYRSFNHTNKAIEMQVGLEANNFQSTSERWNEHGFQIYQNGTWRYWPSGELYMTSTTGIVRWNQYPRSIYTETTEVPIIIE